MVAPRTMRTGRHRRGRSLAPPAPSSRAAESSAPAQPSELARAASGPELDPIEPLAEAPPQDESYDPLARTFRLVVGRLAIGFAVACALLASFALARTFMTPAAADLATSTSTSTSPPHAAPSVEPPAEKRSAPPRAATDEPAPQDDAPDPDLDVVLARAERWEVRAALEVGDLRRAVDVGDRAVRHDPSEADGWLLLAAAHLDLHDDHAANRALASCAKRATHGPRGECIALLPPELPER